MDIFAQVRAFEKVAHKILSTQEASAESRVISLDESYKRLAGLSVAQEDLFKQALRCASEGLYRAAHVMCWAALMDFILEGLESHGIKKLQIAYPKWQVTNDAHELAEYVSEAQLLLSLQKLTICKKNEVKALTGLLNKRNECAHPSEYLPALNETLGYISECFQRLENLKGKF